MKEANINTISGTDAIVIHNVLKSRKNGKIRPFKQTVIDDEIGKAYIAGVIETVIGANGNPDATLSGHNAIRTIIESDNLIQIDIVGDGDDIKYVIHEFPVKATGAMYVAYKDESGYYLKKSDLAQEA